MSFSAKLRTEFLNAFQKQDNRTVKILIDQVKNDDEKREALCKVINQSGRHSTYPNGFLFHAIQNKQTKIAKSLASLPGVALDVGQSLEVRDEKGEKSQRIKTPLMEAVRFNLPKVVKALLAAGASPNIKTFIGFTNPSTLEFCEEFLLIDAFQRGYSEIVYYLAEKTVLEQVSLPTHLQQLVTVIQGLASAKSDTYTFLKASAEALVIGSVGAKALAKALEHYQGNPIILNLASQNIEDAGLAALIPHLGKLKGLNIAGNSLTNTILIKMLDALIADKQAPLQQLSLAGHHLDTKTIQKLTAWLKTNPNLQSLDLSDCGLNRNHWERLALALIKNTQVTQLILLGNTINSVSFWPMLRAARQRTLKPNAPHIHWQLSSATENQADNSPAAKQQSILNKVLPHNQFASAERFSLPGENLSEASRFYEQLTDEDSAFKNTQDQLHKKIARYQRLGCENEVIRRCHATHDEKAHKVDLAELTLPTTGDPFAVTHYENKAGLRVATAYVLGSSLYIDCYQQDVQLQLPRLKKFTHCLITNVGKLRLCGQTSLSHGMQIAEAQQVILVPDAKLIMPFFNAKAEKQILLCGQVNSLVNQLEAPQIKTTEGARVFTASCLQIGPPNQKLVSKFDNHGRLISQGDVLIHASKVHHQEHSECVAGKRYLVEADFYQDAGKSKCGMLCGINASEKIELHGQVESPVVKLEAPEVVTNTAAQIVTTNYLQIGQLDEKLEQPNNQSVNRFTNQGKVISQGEVLIYASEVQHQEHSEWYISEKLTLHADTFTLQEEAVLHVRGAELQTRYCEILDSSLLACQEELAIQAEELYCHGKLVAHRLYVESPLIGVATTSVIVGNNAEWHGDKVEIDGNITVQDTLQLMVTENIEVLSSAKLQAFSLLISGMEHNNLPKNDDKNARVGKLVHQGTLVADYIGLINLARIHIKPTSTIDAASDIELEANQVTIDSSIQARNKIDVNALSRAKLLPSADLRSYQISIDSDNTLPIQGSCRANGKIKLKSPNNVLVLPTGSLRADEVVIESYSFYNAGNLRAKQKLEFLLNGVFVNGWNLSEQSTKSSVQDKFCSRMSTRCEAGSIRIVAPICVNVLQCIEAKYISIASLLYFNILGVISGTSAISTLFAGEFGINTSISRQALSELMGTLTEFDKNKVANMLWQNFSVVHLMSTLKIAFPFLRAWVNGLGNLALILLNGKNIFKRLSALSSDSGKWEMRNIIPVLVGVKDIAFAGLQARSQAQQVSFSYTHSEVINSAQQEAVLPALGKIVAQTVFTGVLGASSTEALGSLNLGFEFAGASSQRSVWANHHGFSLAGQINREFGINSKYAKFGYGYIGNSIFGPGQYAAIANIEGPNLHVSAQVKTYDISMCADRFTHSGNSSVTGQTGMVRVGDLQQRDNARAEFGEGVETFVGQLEARDHANFTAKNSQGCYVGNLLVTDDAKVTIGNKEKTAGNILTSANLAPVTEQLPSTEQDSAADNTTESQQVYALTQSEDSEVTSELVPADEKMSAEELYEAMQFTPPSSMEEVAAQKALLSHVTQQPGTVILKAKIEGNGQLCLYGVVGFIDNIEQTSSNALVAKSSVLRFGDAMFKGPIEFANTQALIEGEFFISGEGHWLHNAAIIGDKQQIAPGTEIRVVGTVRFAGDQIDSGSGTIFIGEVEDCLELFCRTGNQRDQVIKVGHISWRNDALDMSQVLRGAEGYDKITPLKRLQLMTEQYLCIRGIKFTTTPLIVVSASSIEVLPGVNPVQGEMQLYALQGSVNLQGLTSHGNIKAFAAKEVNLMSAEAANSLKGSVCFYAGWNINNLHSSAQAEAMMLLFAGRNLDNRAGKFIAGNGLRGLAGGDILGCVEVSEVQHEYAPRKYAPREKVKVARFEAGKSGEGDLLLHAEGKLDCQATQFESKGDNSVTAEKGMQLSAYVTAPYLAEEKKAGWTLNRKKTKIRREVPHGCEIRADGGAYHYGTTSGEFTAEGAQFVASHDSTVQGSTFHGEHDVTLSPVKVTETKETKKRQIRGRRRKKETHEQSRPTVVANPQKVQIESLQGNINLQNALIITPTLETFLGGDDAEVTLSDQLLEHRVEVSESGFGVMFNYLGKHVVDAIKNGENPLEATARQIPGAAQLLGVLEAQGGVGYAAAAFNTMLAAHQFANSSMADMCASQPILDITIGFSCQKSTATYTTPGPGGIYVDHYIQHGGKLRQEGLPVYIAESVQFDNVKAFYQKGSMHSYNERQTKAGTSITVDLLALQIKDAAVNASKFYRGGQDYVLAVFEVGGEMHVGELKIWEQHAATAKAECIVGHIEEVKQTDGVSSQTTKHDEGGVHASGRVTANSTRGKSTSLTHCGINAGSGAELSVDRLDQNGTPIFDAPGASVGEQITHAIETEEKHRQWGASVNLRALEQDQHPAGTAAQVQSARTDQVTRHSVQGTETRQRGNNYNMQFTLPIAAIQQLEKMMSSKSAQDSSASKFSAPNDVTLIAADFSDSGAESKAEQGPAPAAQPAAPAAVAPPAEVESMSEPSASLWSQEPTFVYQLDPQALQLTNAGYPDSKYDAALFITQRTASGAEQLEALGDGMLIGAKLGAEGMWHAVTHPVDTIEGMSLLMFDATSWLANEVFGVPPIEESMQRQQAYARVVENFVADYNAADPVGKSRIQGQLVGNVLVGAGAGKALQAGSQAMRLSRFGLMRQPRVTTAASAHSVASVDLSLNPKASWGNYRPAERLRMDSHGNKIPDSSQPHTQIGHSRRRDYTQAREWGHNAEGQLVVKKDIDFTDHGRPSNHPNPHQHVYLDNPTGGTSQRSKVAEPLSFADELSVEISSNSKPKP
jgi:hypothetical protein